MHSGCTLNASLLHLSDGGGVQQNPPVAFGWDPVVSGSGRLVASQLEFACTLPHLEGRPQRCPEDVVEALAPAVGPDVS